MCVLPNRMPSGNLRPAVNGFVSVLAAAENRRLAAGLVVGVQNQRKPGQSPPRRRRF